MIAVSFNKHSRVLVAGVLTAGALGIGVPAAAAAESEGLGTAGVTAPTNCRIEKIANRRADAYCTGGNGQFRVTITCTARKSGDIVILNGKWTAPGPKAISTRTCTPSYNRTYAGIQKIN